MAKAVVKANDVKRPIPKYKSFICKICGVIVDNETFAMDNDKDCPSCENRDCLRQL